MTKWYVVAAVVICLLTIVLPIADVDYVDDDDNDNDDVDGNDDDLTIYTNNKQAQQIKCWTVRRTHIQTYSM